LAQVWNAEWRKQAWDALRQPWDVIIIGGGITGAGILREAARLGVRTLLLEADDFASGTSSRSSKLVHGGFRYLRNAQIKLTWQAVRERERLLKEGRGLVTPLGFLLACYRNDRLPIAVFGAGLALYDLLALKWGHRYYDASELRQLCTYLKADGLCGGYRYFDAQTDDARLVLRLLREAALDGGLALNYVRVDQLLRDRGGQVVGVLAHDLTPDGAGRTVEALTKVVINATGAWADEMRRQVGGTPRLRKLRGSHLIFPISRLPLTRAVSFQHPKDGRPVFAFPWEGVTLLGTTDVDHGDQPETDPSISAMEAEYLLAAVQHLFPSLELSAGDIQATFAGLRAVVGTGKADPSKESREHVIWEENGLLTVTGGKLTTFRLMAQDALRRILRRLPGVGISASHPRALNAPPAEEYIQSDLQARDRLRLLGRYGADAPDLLGAAAPGDLMPLGNTPYLQAELRWAARAEAVQHLDDLLLRRVRLGIVLPRGGLDWLERIRTVVQPELGWDDIRWLQEAEQYIRLWSERYWLPEQ